MERRNFLIICGTALFGCAPGIKNLKARMPAADAVRKYMPEKTRRELDLDLEGLLLVERPEFSNGAFERKYWTAAEDIEEKTEEYVDGLPGRFDESKFNERRAPLPETIRQGVKRFEQLQLSLDLNALNYALREIQDNERDDAGNIAGRIAGQYLSGLRRIDKDYGIDFNNEGLLTAYTGWLHNYRIPFFCNFFNGMNEEQYEAWVDRHCEGVDEIRRATKKAKNILGGAANLLGVRDVDAQIDVMSDYIIELFRSSNKEIYIENMAL